MKKQERSPMPMSGLPIIDKDRIPPLVLAYRETLKANGVNGRGLRRAVNGVETTLYDGNPRVTAKSMDRLEQIVTPKVTK